MRNGFGLIEVIVGLAIISVAVFSLLRAYNYYLKFGLFHKHDIEASLLLEEGIEAVKLMRDFGWGSKISSLTPGIVYRLSFADSAWTGTTTRGYVDGVFDRTFVLSDVYRDSNDDITGSGTFDPNTKKVVVYVSYRNGLGTTTKSIGAYVTNLFDN